ncbi:MAG: cation-translocating P-type ATPase [Bacillota bacterium]
MHTEQQWQQLDPEQVMFRLGTDITTGLTESEARGRLRRYGPNVLRTFPHQTPWLILGNQFKDFSVAMLCAAACISLWLGEIADALTIAAIVTINAILGFVQEYKAERAVEALNRISCPSARVLRGGRLQLVDATQLVPGDVIRLEPGDLVPADSRVLRSYGMAVEESCLTGESVPTVKVEVAGADNTVYMGTTVVRGSALAVVLATGRRTRIGKVAELLATAGESSTPLKRRLERLSRALVLVCVGLCVALVVLGLGTDEDPYRAFLAGVSLAVAAIPEGLPAVVTVALTLGVQRMAKRNAIVRKLPAVETLGCTTVICTDKTGTLTQNRMQVHRFVTASQLLDAHHLEASPLRSNPELQALLDCAVHCNNAELLSSGQSSGDPTEAALLVAAQRAGVQASSSTVRSLRAFEFPFDSHRQMMSVVARWGSGWMVFSKGAPEAMLPRCAFELLGDNYIPLNPSRREFWTAQLSAMAKDGLRVLAFAAKPSLSPTPSQLEAETGLGLIGLIGLWDPPRPEAPAALDSCRAAGITPIMVTGDHPETAACVASQLGLMSKGSHVVTGKQIDQMSDRELAACLSTCRVFARVSPENKLRIVKALKGMNHIVAMTGDGVNDAPAIKEAHIGIAMGVQGTEVAREAAHMVLADDNFATIVAAIGEGRTIYQNIRKFINYLLACNVGEVLTMFIAVLAGLPLPLLPIQILFVNLVTDGLPALALGLDPPSPSVMTVPPRPPAEPIISLREAAIILLRGGVIACCTLIMFAYGVISGRNLATARTMAFATLVLSQLVYAFECRGGQQAFALGTIVQNPYLSLAVLSSAAATAFVLYNSTLNVLFSTVPLSQDQLIVVFLASAPSAIWWVFKRTLVALARI